MRVRWFVLWTVLALLWLACPAAAQAQDKSLVWQRFDVDIEVRADGTFRVDEQQNIRFTKGSFSSGYRDIPIRNFKYLDGWKCVDGHGNVYRQATGGDDPYTFVVQQSGGSYVVNWFFPPAADTAETYTLSYTVHDGLRYYDAGDQVWWKAIYANRPFPVLGGKVKVTVPQAATIQQWSAYINKADARASATASLLSGGQAIVYDLKRTLDPGKEFEVRVQFTPKVVDGSVQPWQAKADADVAERDEEVDFRSQWGPVVTLVSCVLGLLFGLGGPAGVYLLWYRRGRDKPVEQVAEYLPEPPTLLAPGLAGTLLDESVDMRQIIATLVDLAQRKVISITQVRKKGLFRSSWDFIYRRERGDVNLRDYEEKLLKGMFGRRSQVKLSDLKEKFYTKIDGIKGSMYDAVVMDGYFPTHPYMVRSTYTMSGAVAMISSVLLAAIGYSQLVLLSDFGWAPGAGLCVAALALIVAARYMPRKTDKGAEEAARWRAFRTYLRNIKRYADLDAQKEIWDRFLPYAIAFGVDREYIRQFEGVDAPAPGWYVPGQDRYGPYRRGYFGLPYDGGGGTASLPEGGGSMGGSLSDMSSGMGSSLSAMSKGLGAMLKSASSTMTSRPRSTPSGGGWRGGGGVSFSGGGGSGGGGGGGGGGGFR